MKTFWLTLLACFCCTAPAFAGANEIQVPDFLQSFVELQTVPIALAAADLNGDGVKDFILVLEKQKTSPNAPEIMENQRPLLIILGGKNNRLRLAKRNEKIVYCSTCGGAGIGDAFNGVKAERNSFTVSQYGGSFGRWVDTFKFNYSARDRTWQLVRATFETFNSDRPDKIKTKIYQPPKDFGKIDIADFDPENFKKRGVK